VKTGKLLECRIEISFSKDNSEYQMRTLVFPKSTRSGNSIQSFGKHADAYLKSRWLIENIAVLIAVLTYIYEALVTGVPITKR